MNFWDIFWQVWRQTLAVTIWTSSKYFLWRLHNTISFSSSQSLFWVWILSSGALAERVSEKIQVMFEWTSFWTPYERLIYIQFSSQMSTELWLHNHPHKWKFEFTVSIFDPATPSVHKMITHSFVNTARVCRTRFRTLDRRDNLGIVSICLQLMIYQ